MKSFIVNEIPLVEIQRRIFIQKSPFEFAFHLKQTHEDNLPKLEVLETQDEIGQIFATAEYHKN